MSATALDTALKPKPMHLSVAKDTVKNGLSDYDRFIHWLVIHQHRVRLACLTATRMNLILTPEAATRYWIRRIVPFVKVDAKNTIVSPTEVMQLAQRLPLMHEYAVTAGLPTDCRLTADQLIAPLECLQRVEKGNFGNWYPRMQKRA